MGDDGGGGPGVSIGPDVAPGGDDNIVVDHSDSSGIVLGADGGGSVVLPRPARPDDDHPGDDPDDPVAPAGPPGPAAS